MRAPRSGGGSHSNRRPMTRLVFGTLVLAAGVLVGAAVPLGSAEPTSPLLLTSMALPEAPPPRARGDDVLEARRLPPREFTHPLIGCGPRDPDVGRLSRVDAALEAGAAEHLEAGRALAISTFLIDLESGSWTGVDADRSFPIGGLDRLVWLMAALARREVEPAIDVTPEARDPAQALDPALRAMLLGEEAVGQRAVADTVGAAAYNQVLTDFGVAANPTPSASARQLTELIRALYDASYLPLAASDRALRLLNEASTESALEAAAGPGVAVSEVRAVSPGAVHECGVVYLKRRPYAMCILTQGADPGALARVVRDLAQRAHQGMSAVRL